MSCCCWNGASLFFEQFSTVAVATNVCHVSRGNREGLDFLLGKMILLYDGVSLNFLLDTKKTNTHREGGGVDTQKIWVGWLFFSPYVLSLLSRIYWQWHTIGNWDNLRPSNELKKKKKKGKLWLFICQLMRAWKRRWTFSSRKARQRALSQ